MALAGARQPGEARLRQANSWVVMPMIETTAEALAAHPFLHGLSHDHLAVLADTACDVTFPARHRLFEDGGSANRFWLLQSGHVTLDLHVPGQGRMKIETIGMGELLGWSWLFPPYRWAFGAVAASPVEAFEFDARAVRGCCESDPALGYELTTRLARVLARRLQATRIRLITAAGHPASLGS
jgi:CRP/FNR family transcriptional regulator, cyclic AMP receptor protein